MPPPSPPPTPCPTTHAHSPIGHASHHVHGSVAEPHPLDFFQWVGPRVLVHRSVKAAISAGGSPRGESVSSSWCSERAPALPPKGSTIGALNLAAISLLYSAAASSRGPATTPTTTTNQSTARTHAIQRQAATRTRRDRGSFTSPARGPGGGVAVQSDDVRFMPTT